MSSRFFGALSVPRYHTMKVLLLSQQELSTHIAENVVKKRRPDTNEKKLCRSHQSHGFTMCLFPHGTFLLCSNGSIPVFQPAVCLHNNSIHFLRTVQNTERQKDETLLGTIDCVVRTRCEPCRCATLGHNLVFVAGHFVERFLPPSCYVGPKGLC